jgi:hypothetical protein
MPSMKGLKIDLWIEFEQVLFKHRKKPRLPGIRRKVPTAVHTIGTAHAAPEVPELFYA